MVLGWALKWSNVSPSNLRDPLFNGSSPRLKKRKRRGWREKEWQTVITKATTVWFCDGSLGENQWIVRSGWATCCMVTKIWSASMNLFMFKKTPIIIFLLSSNSRSGYRISYQIGFFFLPNDTLIDVQIDAQTDVHVLKPLKHSELFATHDHGRGVRRGVYNPKGLRGFSTCHCNVNWTLRKWTSRPIVSNGLLLEMLPAVWIWVCIPAPGYVHLHFLASLKFTAFSRKHN